LLFIAFYCLFKQQVRLSESAISGTPFLLSVEAAKKRLIRENDGKIMTAILPDNNQRVENKRKVNNGELAAAATAGKYLFISYIKKENEKRGVRLSFIDNSKA
jgi:hypothetical protein